MKKKAFDSKMQAMDRAMSLENRSADMNRARSVAVGTCFGGTTELTIRCNDGRVIWAPMQPVEVIELIHQLAANVGCHLQLKPRDDFASWRNWRVTDEEKKQLNGHPPFVNDMALHMQVGADLPPPEQQPGLKIEQPLKEQENVVATEKTIKRRSTKRTAKAS